MKRLVDFSISITLVVLLMPILVMTAFVVRLKLGTPVIFSQTRPGLHGKLFTLYKFRSMTDERGEDGQLLADERRFSRFSRFLRGSSLDELPEFINVIKGDMSLVGPRPLLRQYLKLYNPEQERRHDVKPGITGWAQVNGRNLLSWDEKFKMDVWYVDNKSLWLDVKILFLTIIQVYKREGVSQSGHVTAKEFMGNMDHGK